MYFQEIIKNSESVEETHSLKLSEKKLEMISEKY